MYRIPALLTLLLLSTLCSAQRPDRPLLPLPTWSLTDYRAVDSATAFSFPEGVSFASMASVAITPEGNLLAFSRGPQPFLEFDPSGKLLRTFGNAADFTRPHGLEVDADGNLWITDVGAHYVRKLDKDGNVLMTLGTPGSNGVWDEAAGAHFFDQPNQTAFDSAGNLYVAQGHTAGEPKILKFTADGQFIKQWGSRGNGPGQFYAAHSIDIDTNDKIYIADRENNRIQFFDTEGSYLGEWNFNTLVCSLFLHDDGFLYITTGYDAEFAKLDMEGNLLGSFGSSGPGVGQFGEAHYMVLDKDSNVYIADVFNNRVQKFVKE